MMCCLYKIALIFAIFVQITDQKRDQLSVRFGISDQVRRVIVDQHNLYRRLVANGKVANQPPAANMKMIKWNKDLEILSRLWADQCIFKHRSTDYNDNTNSCGAAGYDWVAENLFVKSTHTASRGPKRVVEVIRTIKHAIMVWFNEHSHFTFPDTCRQNKLCGHYSQIVWADTAEVGCAITLCKNIDMFKYQGLSYNFVCSYGPGGNIDGKAPYLIGPAGSRCPQTQPINVDGLCGGTGVRQCLNVNSTRNCAFWRRQGLCQMCQPSYSFMQRNCYKTCDMCQQKQQKFDSFALFTTIN